MGEITRSAPTDARDTVGDLAPDFAKMTDELLYGAIWNDTNLSLRDRSLITVASLMSLYRLEQIDSHLSRALSNGVTKEELVAAIHHLAFYAGWPAAFTTMTHLRTLLGDYERHQSRATGRTVDSNITVRQHGDTVHADSV